VLQDQLSGNKIDVNQLPNGMYFLEVNTGNEVVSKRFIIIN
jgi:hypothetical protein